MLLRCGDCGVLAHEHELVLRLPDFQQHHEADDRGQRGENVDELRTNEVRDGELHAREADADDDRGRQNALESAESAHD